MSVYVVTHKMLQEKIDLPSIYQNLVVGGNSDLARAMSCHVDSEGASISSYNSSFCELTGMYWIWKNCKEDIKGLVHYRRYFVNSIISRSYRTILDIDDINSRLDKVDLILPFKKYVDGSVKNDYLHWHPYEDFDVLEKTVRRICPSYGSAFNQVVNGKYIYPYNMLIGKCNIFDDYCDWLFPILFECKKHIDLEDRDIYQRRVFGFLSERLMAVWVLKNKINVIETPVLFTEKIHGTRLHRLIERYTH